MPQSYWLGTSLKYFTIISQINNIKPFVDGVNNFFQKNIEFPKIQTGGSNINITLNKAQIKKIKKIYSSDYELIRDFL